GGGVLVGEFEGEFIGVDRVDGCFRERQTQTDRDRTPATAQVEDVAGSRVRGGRAEQYLGAEIEAVGGKGAAGRGHAQLMSPDLHLGGTALLRPLWGGEVVTHVWRGSSLVARASTARAASSSSAG